MGRVPVLIEKGINSHQLHRTLGVIYTKAWFLCDYLRHAMTSVAGLMGPGTGVEERRVLGITGPSWASNFKLTNYLFGG